MRTTVALPPAVHRRVRELAASRHQSMSAVIADLTLRGLAQFDVEIAYSRDERSEVGQGGEAGALMQTDLCGQAQQEHEHGHEQAGSHPCARPKGTAPRVAHERQLQIRLIKRLRLGHWPCVASVQLLSEWVRHCCGY